MKYLKHIEEYFLGFSLAVMVLINFGNVMSRYFIHASWSFSEEIMMILFVWNSFLGAAVAFKLGAHLGLSLLTDFFPEKFQKYVIIFSALLTIALMAILTKYGMEMIKTQFIYNQKTPALGLPEWVAGASVPVGALFIIFRTIHGAYLQIKERGL